MIQYIIENFHMENFEFEINYIAFTSLKIMNFNEDFEIGIFCIF